MEKPWKNPRFLLVTPWPLRRLVHGVWAMIVRPRWVAQTLLVWRWWPMRWAVGNGWETAHYVGSLANGSLISRMVSYNLQLCSFPWRCDCSAGVECHRLRWSLWSQGRSLDTCLNTGSTLARYFHILDRFAHCFLFTFLALCWYSFGEKSKPNSLVYRCDHQETVEMVHAQWWN